MSVLGNGTGPTGRNLRIAALCGSIKPLFSGTDDYHERLLTALAQAGADPVVIDIHDWRLQRIGALLRAVAAARPDVILLQYPTDAFGRSLLPQLFATIQRIAPLAVTMHEFYGIHPLRRLALTPFLLRAGGLVMTAQREVDGLRSWYPWMRRSPLIIPVGNTFPPQAWRPDPDQPPSIVYFGQIRPDKGLEYFIACHDQLVTQFPSARFSVVGSHVPHFAAYHAEIAAAAAARNITMLNGLTETDVSAALAAADCALLPYPDGVSFRRTSMLAAASCGAPIVTLAGLDTPPNLTALLQPATSPDQLAGMVAALLTSTAARQDSHARSLQVAAHVSWDSIASRYMEMLNALARPADRPPRLGRRQAASLAVPERAGP